MAADILTFLFTDIEGSTRLWEAYPNAMRSALIRHDALVESLVAMHEGTVVRPRGEGDSRFAVFARPTNAVTAAFAIQLALQREAWDLPEPVRVRIAVHSGAADQRDGDYYGSPVNRCARLRALGHGGQVLISGVTAALVLGTLPPHVALRKLGTYRLKDMLEPEAVFQLVHPELWDRFPTLHAPSWWRGRLPNQPNPLIGRAHELEELRTSLRLQDVRLLTLVGPGGVGKTRLAIAAARDAQPQFADGLYFADLSSLHDAGLVIPTVAAAIGLRETSDQSAFDVLREHIGQGQVLLVLDNCEHVVDAASDLANLLETSPELKVLATSRVPLRLRWEHIYEVPPLAQPSISDISDPQSLGRVAAIALFVERAQAADRGFRLTVDNVSVVTELCRRLDGLPLALELAAARVRGSPPALLLQQLSVQPSPIAGARDAPARHQSLWAVADWSYKLLSLEEQALFRLVGIFPGGCTVAAVEAVIGLGVKAGLPATLMSLVDKSLLQREIQPGREPRFRMLETIRDYAFAQLNMARERHELASAQASYFVALAEESELGLRGPQLMSWLERLDQEDENIRAVLRRADDYRQPEIVLRLAAALWYYWHVRARIREGRYWLERGLALAATLPPVLKAKALQAAGAFAAESGDITTAREWLQEALELRLELGDAGPLAASLNSIGVLNMWTGQYPAAHHFLQRALALESELGKTWRIAVVLSNLGWLALLEGEVSRAAELHEESLKLWQSLGHDEGAAALYVRLALVARSRGDRPGAEAFVERGLSLGRGVGSHEVLAFGLFMRGLLLADAGAADDASPLLQQSLELYQEIGMERSALRPLEALVDVALLKHDIEAATRLLGATDSIRASRNWPRPYPDQIDFERRLAAACASLQDLQFARAWAQGKAMSYAQVIGYATR